MKNIIKKISFAFILFVAMATTVNAATTIKETASDFTDGKAYYVIGSTKFEDVTLTSHAIGEAYRYELARLGIDADVKELYRSSISGKWSTIKEDGSMTPISDTEVYKDLDIYFVNNDVKLLDLKLDTDEKIGNIDASSATFVTGFADEKFSELKTEMKGKVTYNANTKTFKVPAIMSAFSVELGDEKASTSVSVNNGTLVKTAALLVTKVTDIAGKELTYNTNANGDIDITSKVPFEVKTDSTATTRKNGVVLYFPETATAVTSVEAYTIGTGDGEDQKVTTDIYGSLEFGTAENSKNKTLTIDMAATNSGAIVDYDYLLITIDTNKKIKLSAKDVEAAPVGKVTRVAYFSENEEVKVDNVKIENANVTINKTLPAEVKTLRIYVSAPAGYVLSEVAKTNSSLKQNGNEYYFEINTSDISDSVKTADVVWATNNTQKMNIIYAEKVKGEIKAFATDVDAEGAKDVHSSLSGVTIPALDNATATGTHYLNVVVVKPAGYVGTPKFAVADATNLNRSKENANDIDKAIAAVKNSLTYTNLPENGLIQVKFAVGDNTKLDIKKVVVYVKWNDEAEIQEFELDASSATFETLPAVIKAEDVSTVFDSENDYRQHILELSGISIVGADNETDATNNKYTLSSSNSSVVKVITQADVDAGIYYKTGSANTKIDKDDIGKLLIIGSGEANVTIKSDRLGSITKVIKIKVTTPVKFTYELKEVSANVGTDKTFDLTVNPTGGSGEYSVSYSLYEEDESFTEAKYTSSITANSTVRITVADAYKGLKITVKDANIDGAVSEIKIKVTDNTVVE